MDKKEELKALLAESDALLEEGKKYLELKGVKYSLSQWVTLKKYASLYGLESTNVVSNWIARGIIPPENVITIPELNDIRLVKAIPYKDTDPEKSRVKS
jgi:hypothetical protein